MTQASDTDVDFGKTARDYGQYRAGFPAALFARLAAAGIGRPGQRALDLGTGTGTVARQLAARGCAVVGLDRAATLLAEARRLDAEAGVRVTYLRARAEATGLHAHAFEVVAAGQCWHWFDRAGAAGEARRVLVPGGALVIAHFDWIPLAGNVVDASEALILRHNPAWRMAGGTGLYPAWLADVAQAGFTGIETFSFDLPVPYSHVAWRGRVRASAGVGASLPEAGVRAFDAAHAAMLRERFPEEPLAVPHRVWAVVCRRP